MTEELVKRLRSTYTRPYKHEATTFGARVSTISVDTFYHNPDGPEAVAAIEGLQAEIRHLMSELQAHKDALAQAAPKP
jgi:hypothetical protein